MSRCCIDHIVVTAPSLEAGAGYIAQTLGVAPQAGGEHLRMGTHNLLLRLGESVYLEVIAPNPGAPAPARPRWFGLDSLLPDSRPALSTWVARTTDIQAATAACPEPLGGIEAMSRGTLNWLITIPADGVVPLDGVAPALIEWHVGVHPATRLQDLGLSLVELRIFHPDAARVAGLLSALNLEGPVSVAALPGNAAPYLLACIDTPQGVRQLSPADLLAAGPCA